MYKLTEEQINEIVSEYGGDALLISDIERELNISGKVDNEVDYEKLVIDCISTYESTQEIIKQKILEEDKEEEFKSLNEIVTYCLDRYLLEKGLETSDSLDYTKMI